MTLLNVSVADDQIGQYYRRVTAIADRLGKSVDFDYAMDVLQGLHDGTLNVMGVPNPAQPDPASAVPVAPHATAEPKVYLRPLFENVDLGPTGGTTTDDDASRMFPGYYDPALLGVKSKPAPATKTRVDKLTENGKFADFLGKTAAQLEARRLQWEQGIKFCRDHRDKLRKGGYATFFVCTIDGEAVREDLSNVFVAGVDFGGHGRLDVDRSSVSDADVWYADYEHHVVSRQL